MQDISTIDSIDVQSYIDVYKREIYTTRQHRKKIIESEYFMLKKILRLT